MSPYRGLVLAQLLDGKRSWEMREIGGDADDFLTQVVIPLRELRYEGVIQNVEELTAASEGEVNIFAVEIIGAINYADDE